MGPKWWHNQALKRAFRLIVEKPNGQSKQREIWQEANRNSVKKKWTNEAPRNAGNQITMSFSLASHCSKGWSERSGPITEQSLLANSRRDQKLRHSLNNIVSRHCNFSKGLGNLVGIETSNQVWQLCTFQSRIKLKLFVWSYCFYFFCIHPKVAHIQPLEYL